MDALDSTVVSAGDERARGGIARDRARSAPWPDKESRETVVAMDVPRPWPVFPRSRGRVSNGELAVLHIRSHLRWMAGRRHARDGALDAARAEVNRTLAWAER